MDGLTSGGDTPNAGGAAPVAPLGGDGPLSVRQAADAFARRREQDSKPDTAASQRPAQRQDEQVSAHEADAAPDQASGEIEARDPAPEPSIDPPRSWSKEDKELFQSLPRETQERIADRERSRDSDFSRRQNEASKAREAAEAERQRYEQALPQLLQAIQVQMQSEFGDLKSLDDVKRLAEEDPFRFNKFQAFKMQLELAHAEVQKASERQAQEADASFKEWSAQQDAEFIKSAPEYANEKTATEARREVVEYLTKVRGVTQDEIGSLWNGKGGISIRNAKVQMIIRDAARYHAGQKAAKAAVPQAAPAPQRPGTSPAVRPQDANVQALQRKLDSATSTQSQLRAAAALRAAKRAAAR